MEECCELRCELRGEGRRARGTRARRRAEHASCGAAGPSSGLSSDDDDFEGGRGYGSRHSSLAWCVLQEEL